MTKQALSDARGGMDPRSQPLESGWFRVPSQLGIWGVALGCAAGMFAATLVVQWYIYVELLGQDGTRLVGPIVSSVLTLIYVQRMMAASRRRRLATLHRFQIIAEMNHHIRNSLQLISYQRFTVDDEAAARLKDAIDRIEWVLEQVLPTVYDDSGKSGKGDDQQAA